MGNGVATTQLMKMVAGAINPGKPVANLYVRLVNFPSYTTDTLMPLCSSQCGATT